MRCDEEILGGGEDRCETLQSTGCTEALHQMLLFSQWQIKILCAIVPSIVVSAFDRRHEVTFERSLEIADDAGAAFS